MLNQRTNLDVRCVPKYGMQVRHAHPDLKIQTAKNRPMVRGSEESDAKKTAT